MNLYNCENKIELDLKALDLELLSVGELRSLTVDVKTHAMNDKINDIIALDALSEIIMELVSRVSEEVK